MHEAVTVHASHSPAIVRVTADFELQDSYDKKTREATAADEVSRLLNTTDLKGGYGNDPRQCSRLLISETKFESCWDAAEGAGRAQASEGDAGEGAGASGAAAQEVPERTDLLPGNQPASTLAFKGSEKDLTDGIHKICARLPPCASCLPPRPASAQIATCCALNAHGRAACTCARGQMIGC